jgi:hypothetical protein
VRAVIPVWKHLDGWDIPIFILGFALGVAGWLALGADKVGVAGAGGFSLATGCLALQLRGLANPSLAAKEAGPPPPPLTLVEILLVAFGILGILVSIGVGVLGVAMEVTGPPRKPPIDVRAIVDAVGVAVGAGSVGLLLLARRLRRRRTG